MKNFGLEFIKKLKPVMFRFKAPMNDGREHLGFIAQSVNLLASRQKYGLVGFKKGYMTINYEELFAPVVKAIQELSDKVDVLEKRIDRKNKKFGKIQSNIKTPIKGEN